MFESGVLDKKLLDGLFDKTLKPLHSKNTRIIYKIFYDKQKFDHLTTHDIETKLVEYGITLNKKEINGWLLSLQEAGLIAKLDERGKPVASSYDDRYTFDLWKLTETGLKVGRRIPNLMSVETKSNLPHLKELTPSIIHELEDLYITVKVLTILHEYGDSMSYVNLRKKLAVDREKLAVYSWPDSTHAEKPLFEIKIKPLTLKGKIYKLLGWLSEQDLSFTLTEDGRKIAEEILSKESS